MASAVLGAVGLLVAYLAFRYLSSFRRNLAAAKRSGLPYIVTRTSPSPSMDCCE